MSTALLQNRARAQNERTGLELGLRFGFPSGVSAKFFLPQDDDAFELFLAQSSTNNYASLLFARHASGLNVQGLRWYYGGGAILSSSREEDATAIGAQGVLGLEYRLGKTRFVFSIDWRPGMPLLGVEAASVTADSGGLSARWRF